MAKSKGYYSVMQYCPDTSRAEAANVGLVIFRPEPHALVVKTTNTLARVKRFFKPNAKEFSRIRDAVRAAATAFEMRADDYQTIEEFELATYSMGNEIRLTPPKVLRVQDPRTEVDKLFSELVEDDVPGSAPRPAIVWPTPINQAFEDLRRGNKLIEPGDVTIPLMDRKLHVPYAYQNGELILIKPAVFDDTERDAEKALRLAAEGRLIQNHSDPVRPRCLVVVSAVSARPEAEEHVAPLFHDFDVQLIRQSEAAKFATRMRNEAK
jgi:hypothetical protein